MAEHAVNSTAHATGAHALWNELNELKRENARLEVELQRGRDTLAAALKRLEVIKRAAGETLALLDRFPMHTALLVRQDCVARLREEANRP